MFDSFDDLPIATCDHANDPAAYCAACGLDLTEVEPSPTAKLLRDEPLYRVQRLALIDREAGDEAARRYAADARTETREPYAASWQHQLAQAYLAGLRGGCRTDRRRSNYDAPLGRAWAKGLELRRHLIAEGLEREDA